MDEKRERRSEKEDEGRAAGAGGHSSVVALNEEKWEAMLGRLVAFKQQFGHTQIPYRYPADPQLGRWVSVQRSLYKRIEDGISKSNNTLTDERIQKLNDIDFEWIARDHRTVPWEARYQELADFVRRYGHSQVPIGWEDNVQLATWVSTQRQEYKLLKQGRSTRLTQHRISKLNQLNFIWDAKQRRGATSSPTDQVVSPPQAAATRKPKEKSAVVASSDRSEGKMKSHSMNHGKRRGGKPSPPTSVQPLKAPPSSVLSGQPADEPTAFASRVSSQHQEDRGTHSALLAGNLSLQGELSRTNIVRPEALATSLSQLDSRMPLPYALQLAQSRLRIPGAVDTLNPNVFGSNQSVLSQLSQVLPLAGQSATQNSLLSQASARMAIISAMQGAASQPPPFVAAAPSLPASSPLAAQELILNQLSSSRARIILERLVLQGRISLSEHRLLSLLPPDQQLDIASRLMSNGLDHNRLGGEP